MFKEYLKKKDTVQFTDTVEISGTLIEEYSLENLTLSRDSKENIDKE